MIPLTHEELVTALGAVDDAAAAEILATGATLEDLVLAQTWLINGEGSLHHQADPLAADRVARVLEILETIEDVEPDEAGPNAPAPSLSSEA